MKSYLASALACTAIALAAFPAYACFSNDWETVLDNEDVVYYYNECENSTDWATAGLIYYDGLPKDFRLSVQLMNENNPGGQAKATAISPTGLQTICQAFDVTMGSGQSQDAVLNFYFSECGGEPSGVWVQTF